MKCLAHFLRLGTVITGSLDWNPFLQSNEALCRRSPTPTYDMHPRRLYLTAYFQLRHLVSANLRVK